MPEVQTLMTGLAFGELPRWHENRLWFSNWGTQEVVAVDLDGNGEVPSSQQHCRSRSTGCPMDV
jgi:sugar lactone lactonase YvrE